MPTVTSTKMYPDLAEIPQVLEAGEWGGVQVVEGVGPRKPPELRAAALNLSRALFIQNLLEHINNMEGRRKWQPTPVFLPRESCGQRA